MFSDNVTRASGIKRSLNYSSKVLVSLVLLLAFTPEAASISNGVYSISYSKNTGYDSSCKDYFLGYVKAGNSPPPNLLGFPVLVSKGTFNPPLWQLKTVTGKTDEFTLTAVNTTFSKPARLAYDAAQCVSDTVILSDKGGIRWKLKNGVLTAAARTNCTKIPGSNLILGLSSKGADTACSNIGVVLTSPGSKKMDIWSLKSTKPTLPTTPIKLYGAQNASSDDFGQAVAIQGTFLAVGGRKEAYLFTRATLVTRNWSRFSLVRPSTVPSTSNFGASVAVDGNLVLVGAPGASSGGGFAVLYVVNSKGVQGDEPVVIAGPPSNNLNSNTFGTQVAISGSTLAISAPGDNAVFVYIYENGKLSSPKILAGNNEAEKNFGRLLALSGNTLAIASSSTSPDSSGSVNIYTKKDTLWSVQGKVSCPAATEIGSSVCSSTTQADFPNLNIALYDQTLAVAHAGSVILYDRIITDGKDAGWTQKQTIATTSSLFGSSLALFKQTLLAGEASKVLAYARTADFPSGEWEKSTEITAPEGSGAVGFGTSAAAVFDDLVVVGAPGSEVTPKSNGMAFVYRNPTLQYIMT